MEQGLLFPDLPPPLTDEEIAVVLRAALSRGIRGSREVNLYLTTICAKLLVDEMRLAGLVVVRPSPPRLRP